MKTPSLLLTCGALILATGTAIAQQYTDLTVDNQATIRGAAFFGEIELGQTGNVGLSHAMKLHVTQQMQEVWQSSLIPGYWEDNWVTVEEGEMQSIGGGYVPQYETVVVGTQTIPAVFDEDGNVIEPERTEDVYDQIYIGEVWTESWNSWVVTNTYEENQPIWHADEISTYSEMKYDAPVIHSSASRSDANWVWEVPDENGFPRVLMRLWNGGLGMAGMDGQIKMAMTGNRLSYVTSDTVAGAANSGATLEADAESSKHTSFSQISGVNVQSESVVKAEHVRLTYTHTLPSGIATIKQTQITPQSASFGGLVEVDGDVKVKGVLRVKPQGDLQMGEFTAGPVPE
jgi:hypothetical protein